MKLTILMTAIALVPASAQLAPMKQAPPASVAAKPDGAIGTLDRSPVSLQAIIGLEKEMDTINERLPELRHFILPGGSSAISYCHIARCVCRRAERITVHLAQESPVDEKVNIYLNRLSDYLFTLARKIAFENDIPENQWIPRG